MTRFAASGVIGEQLIVLLDNAREDGRVGLPARPQHDHMITSLARAWDASRRAELRGVPIPGEREIAAALKFPAWISAVAS